MRSAWGWLVAAIAAAACTPKSDVRAKLEDGAAVPAAYTCRKRTGPDVECRLELKTQPPIELAAPLCDNPELAEEASGKAIAHRCPGKPWSVVRLRGGDRYLEDCHAPLGTDPKPDWSKLGPIEPRAMALLDCANGSSRAWEEIARSIAAESGPEAAARFVIASTLRGAGTESRGYVDGWVEAFDALPPPAQELVRKETCPALQKASSPSLLYVRAARRCPHDATNVPEIALEAYKNHLTASRRDFGGSTERMGAAIAPVDLSHVELSFVMEGFIALKQRPKEAAKVSCDAIGSFSREYDPVRVTVAASILALTKTRCPALDRKSDLWPCDLVAPHKSKIAERVGHFGTPPGGAFPGLAAPNEAVFEAVSIDGKYPPDWKCP